jgi:hypothetical protein
MGLVPGVRQPGISRSCHRVLMLDFLVAIMRWGIGIGDNDPQDFATAARHR